jgi:hypothetical protein
MAWFSAKKSFLKAVRVGDLDGVRKGLTKGISPNAADDEGRPALHLAALYGQGAAAQLLLAAGADVNGHSPSYCYPLHEAAFRGDVDLVRALITAGADTNVVINGNGRTALHWAVDKGFTPVIEALLQAGARTDIANHDGRTPLDLAKAHVLKFINGIKPAAVAASKGAQEPCEKETAENEAWELMGSSSVAQASAAPALGRRLTAVFNFDTRERVLVSENLKTGAETMSPPEKFDTLPSDVVRRAEEKFRALGGKSSAVRQLKL